nr:hypothetical protein [Acidovorax sp. 100]
MRHRTEQRHNGLRDRLTGCPIDLAVPFAERREYSRDTFMYPGRLGTNMHRTLFAQLSYPTPELLIRDSDYKHVGIRATTFNYERLHAIEEH